MPPDARTQPTDSGGARVTNPPESPPPQRRAWILWGFTAVEDVVYAGLGLLLAGSAITLLVIGLIDFGQSVVLGKVRSVELLERSLLILLVVELLYTVQVSFRKHALAPEPFLLIGLISAIRRVLVLTAEYGELREKGDRDAQNFFIELAVLTVLILTLAIAYALLRKRGTCDVPQQG
jgi:hypothetical protein